MEKTKTTHERKNMVTPIALSPLNTSPAGKIIMPSKHVTQHEGGEEPEYIAQRQKHVGYISSANVKTSGLC